MRNLICNAVFIGWWNESLRLDIIIPILKRNQISIILILYFFSMCIKILICFINLSFCKYLSFIFSYLLINNSPIRLIITISKNMQFPVNAAKLRQ